GLLVQASCSSRVTAADFYAGVHRAAGDAGYELDEVLRSDHPVDHPVGFPQGAYLKALFARVQPLHGSGAPPDREGQPADTS
ncbi:MAG TPA: hypothetical protein VGV63_04560, partial [Acidimicrobiales bacterium]|nr:hypothetical protein [Acidimicrobiales bacterium]